MWQVLLTELRDDFRIFSVRPKIPITIPCIKNESPDMILEQSKVGPIDSTKRLVPFLATLIHASVPFAFLNRYYVINCVTGAHGLFLCQQKNLNRQEFFSKSSYCPSFERENLEECVYWFIDFAFKAVGTPFMHADFVLTPLQVLEVMASFWYQTSVAQDTIVMCLEV